MHRTDPEQWAFWEHKIILPYGHISLDLDRTYCIAIVLLLSWNFNCKLHVYWLFKLSHDMKAYLFLLENILKGNYIRKGCVKNYSCFQQSPTDDQEVKEVIFYRVENIVHFSAWSVVLEWMSSWKVVFFLFSLPFCFPNSKNFGVTSFSIRQGRDTKWRPFRVHEICDEFWGFWDFGVEITNLDSHKDFITLLTDLLIELGAFWKV